MEVSEEEARNLAAQLGNPTGEDGIAVGQRMLSTNINMIRKSAAALGLKPGSSLAEVGHGNGGHIRELLENYNPASYTGLEISATMQEEAKSATGATTPGTKLNFMLYDGNSIPLEANSIDAILTVNSIYFWKDPGALFQEFRRILRQEGKVAIGLGEKAFMANLPVVKHGFRTYNRNDLLEVLENTGLKLVDFQDHSETVESNMNGLVDRKFHVALLSKD